MSRSVPEFAVGEDLTAEKMKELISAVDKLQQAGKLCPLHAFLARAGYVETNVHSQYLRASGMYGKGTISAQKNYRATPPLPATLSATIGQ